MSMFIVVQLEFRFVRSLDKFLSVSKVFVVSMFIGA